MTKPSPFSSLSRAGELLTVDGRRIVLVEALLLCLPTVGAYVLLGKLYAFLCTLPILVFWELVLLTSGYVLLLCALTLFLALPQAYGFLQMCRAVSHNRTPLPIELFAGFGDGRSYRQMLRLSWRAFWRMLCLAGAVALTMLLVSYIPSPLIAWLVCTLCIIAECILYLWLVLRGFGAAASVLEGADFPVPNRKGGARFALACLPHVLLGLLTLGIYLLWDVLPRIGVAYFGYCRQLHMTLPTEEYKNHE